MNIVVECDECDNFGVTTHVEHEQGSRRAESILDAHRILVNDHDRSTDHEATLEVNK